MHGLIILAALTILSVSTAFAAPAVTTASVNFRTGPGTGYASLGTLREGSQVDLGACDQSGAWCAVTVGGKSGFVSGQYLKANEDKD